MAAVEIVEVGPRDGLQNESVPVSVSDRVDLIRRLGQVGVKSVEVGAFVRTDRVPQMAGSDEVFAGTAGMGFDQRICLVPNSRGLESARRAGVQDVAVFVATSETFNLKNSNCSVDDGLDLAAAVIRESKQEGRTVRGYVSTIAGCPYEGSIDIAQVVRVAERLHSMGCDEISLGDTIGVGRPAQISSIIDAVSGVVPTNRLAFHGHDTYGMGVANALAAIERGVRRIDASVGGLGGCPFGGPRAKGNLATEDLVYALGEDAFAHPFSLSGLIDTAWWLSEKVGHEPRSAVARAGRT
ncbi:MAG: hydroxymethylglutaryl-CoA lyase [Ilumatobacteraceae bacterium]